MNNKLKAVLFDMDGTLIDSMTYHVIAWTQAFEENGYHPGELIFYLNEGVRHPQTVRQRLHELGFDNPSEELVKKIYERKREIFENIVQINPTDGAMELLDMLKGRVKLGIVTGGVRSVTNKVVARLFDGYFDFVVDYESTEKGKPDPDPFLKGIELTGLPKPDILAVENAPTGVKSAVTAGLTCWAVATTLDPKYLSEANRVFKNFHELKQAIIAYLN
jgi:beta-phosphoglucomutase